MSALSLSRPSRQILFALFALLTCLFSANTSAREFGIAFIEDNLPEPSPRLSDLIFQELQPLLNRNDKLAAYFPAPAGTPEELASSMLLAEKDPDIDFIVVTGFIGSQKIYQQARFSKPTYLIRVLDPVLTGSPVRDNERNLRSYSAVNEIAEVFERLGMLFDASEVGILLPPASSEAEKIISSAVSSAARQAGINAKFVRLDYSSAIESQLSGLDAVVLPPASVSESNLLTLLDVLRRMKIPSYEVGDDSAVRRGALISDTLSDEERTLARRVALDLQLVINGEASTRGIRFLEPRKRTTINVETARAIGVDIALDEIMTARIVQGSESALSVGLLSSIELAIERNLGLRGQQAQLQIDQETLEQALAARRPQLSASVSHTRRGEQLPEQDSLASLSVSQTIYSATANTEVIVARLGVNAAQKSLQQKELDTVQQTANAYFQALQTQAQFESSLRDLALNRENLSLAEERKRQGSGTGADIYRWQAILAASETNVLRAFTANTSAQHQLAQLINTRIQVPTTLAEVELDQPPFDLLHEGLSPFLQSTGRSELLREASAARALAQSPQLDVAEANVSAINTQLQSLRRSYYTPELALTSRYSRYLDSSANAAGMELDDQDDWSVSLTATLPLWLGGSRRSLIHQFSAQSDLADTQLESAQLALWANSGDAVNNLVTNFRAIGLSEQAEKAALRSQQITQSAYKLGAASITELLDTQNEFREAQDNVYIARYQYLAALVDFQALMGEMPMLSSGAEQQQWLQIFKQTMLEGAAQ